MRPTVLFDGDCAFCTSCVTALTRWLRPPVTFLPWQRVDLADYGVSQGAVEAAVQWIGPDGRFAGAQAFGAVLRAKGGLWSIPGTLVRIPPVRQLAALAYRLIAANRHRLPGGTAACALPAADRK
jgi:predicted DCC family thiol-disulfide oxidoreductase YuxK